MGIEHEAANEASDAYESSVHGRSLSQEVHI